MGAKAPHVRRGVWGLPRLPAGYRQRPVVWGTGSALLCRVQAAPCCAGYRQCPIVWGTGSALLCRVQAAPCWGSRGLCPLKLNKCRVFPLAEITSP